MHRSLLKYYKMPNTHIFNCKKNIQLKTHNQILKHLTLLPVND